jgi:hypothetical protein
MTPVMSDRYRGAVLTVTYVPIAWTIGKLTVHKYQELNINEVVKAVFSGTDT